MADPLETNLQVNVDARQLDAVLPKLERAAELRQQVASAPGLRTSEGAAALVAAAAPLLSMVLGAKLDWTHIAAFAVVALVAIAYGGYRTLLKLRGLAVLAVLLVPSLAFGDVVVPRPEGSTPRWLVIFLGLTPLALCAVGLLASLAPRSWRRVRRIAWLDDGSSPSARPTRDPGPSAGDDFDPAAFVPPPAPAPTRPRNISPAALVLTLLSTWMALPTRALADDPPLAPTRAPVVAPQNAAPEPAAEPPAAKPQLPGLADLALCTAASIPGAAAKCAGQPPPPDYARITTYSVISSSVTQLVQLAGAYLALRYDTGSPLGR